MRTTIQHTTPLETLATPRDNTSEHVGQQVRMWRGGLGIIHVQIALEIAAGFQTPAHADRPFVVFAGSGMILPGFVQAIDDEIQARINYVQSAYAAGWDTEDHAGSITELHALRAYVVAANRAQYSQLRMTRACAAFTEAGVTKVGLSNAKAQGYAWGWQDCNKGAVRDTGDASEFGYAYGTITAHYEDGKRGTLPSIQRAWEAWISGEDIGNV